jgi:hypothetical protein
MWIIPAILGTVIVYKILTRPSGMPVGNYTGSQEVLDEYDNILAKLDATQYGPFMHISPQNAGLVWTRPRGATVTITVTKNPTFNKLVGEITLKYRGHVYSETTVLSDRSPPPSEQVIPILSRVLRYAREDVR